MKIENEKWLITVVGYTRDELEKIKKATDNDYSTCICSNCGSLKNGKCIKKLHPVNDCMQY